jgi:hypothetical protein
MPCGPLDVAFIIDDTGSMGNTLVNLQSGLAAIMSDIQLASPGNYRIAVVSFKDNVTVRVNFALNNAAAATTAINSLVAGGGSNVPEASDEALNTAVNALPTPGRPQNIDFTPGWRPAAAKIAILVTDALPAGFDDTYSPGVDDVNANNVAVQAASQGIRIGAVFVPTGSLSPVPIMQNYASVTGGIYVQTAPNGTGVDGGIRTIIANCGNGPTSTPTVTPTRTATATPGGMIIGHITWQGSTQPDARQVQTAVLTVCAGSLLTYTITTDASGNFTQAVNLPDGTYNWRIKNVRTLTNGGSLTMTGGTATQEMGVMRAGDANNDNVVNATDFAILKNAFGGSSDLRADFDNNGVVNSIDFNLLRVNFGTAGAGQLACP